MAKRPKKEQNNAADYRKFTPSENYYQFGQLGPAVPVAVPQSSMGATGTAATAAAGLDPQNLPAVANRPSVPATTEQAPETAMSGIMGGIAGFMDKIVPDDMGGIARGESGWTANIPGYDQTLGAVSDVALTGGEAVVNAMTWGTEQMNHLGAALLSWMPGGIQTLDWEQSHQVSVGQVAVANAGAVLKDARGGNWWNSAMSLMGTGAIGMAAIALDQNNASTRSDFDILNAEDRKAAFVDSTAGMWGSGLTDAVWSIAADPTIVGGKASAVLRTGLKVGEFGGLSNQALRTFGQVERFAAKIDDGVKYKATAGADGVWTSEIEHVQDLISKPAHELDNNIFVKNSTNPDLLKRLAVQVDPQDLETGAALVKAGAGLQDGWTALRQIQSKGANDLYDQLASGMGINPLERLPGAAEMTADQIKYGREIVDHTLEKTKNVVDDAATVAADEADMAARAGQLITRGGNRLSPAMARMANAYRGGALKNQFGKLDDGPVVVQDIPVFAKSQWMSTTLRASAGSRPVRAIRWVGQGTPNGIVHLKGGDGSQSSQEVAAFLRKSSMEPEKAAQFMNDFTVAATVEQRKAVLAAMEEADVVAIAAKHDISPQVAKEMYNSYAASRHRHLKTLGDEKAGFAADDMTEELVTTGNLYTQMDESFPMLNQAVFKKVTSANHKWLRNVEDVTKVADTFNTWWKLSVLLRLGYTQRNLTEGALRSFAVLGLAASNPKAMMALPANTIRYGATLGARRSVKNSSNLLLRAHENLLEAQRVLATARREAGVEDFAQLGQEMSNVRRTIKALQKKETRTAAEEKRLADATAAHAEIVAKRTEIQKTRIDPAMDNIKNLSADEQAALARIEGLKQQVLDATKALRAKNAKRKVGGKSENTMYDGTPMAGAFQGTEGEIAALLSSADQTIGETINLGLASRKAILNRSAEFKKLDPKTMKPADMERYFDEYTIRLNQTWRHDPIIKMWLKRDGDPALLEDTKAWLMSSEGQFYRRSIETPGYKLETAAGLPNEAAIERFVQDTWTNFERQIPKDSGLRELLRDHEISPAELQAKLAGRKLPSIPARDIHPGSDNLFARLNEGAKNASGIVMKYLGSVPETKMLRHPFYNKIYTERQNQLYALAAKQGMKMDSEIVRTSINRAAHAEALRATRSTMYTIERMSNAAMMLRWVSPFFPAFENSVRTWARIAYQNPAVLGWGNKLWNIPNNMGWVVDPKTGERVDHSNMFRNEGYYIVWPKQIADVFAKDTPFTPGEAVMTPQGGLNVVFPGGEPWFPGVGPMTQIPTALVLRGRPETTDVIRSMMSEEMFKNVVPGGNPNTDLFESMLPTWIKRVKQMHTGMSEDGAYLSLMQTMTEDEYIRAQMEGRSVSPADIKRVEQKAQKFYTWQVMAALGAPAQSTYMSQFNTERMAWKQLQDDTSLTWQQKNDAFMAKFPNMGDALLAITRSGSKSETGLQPTLATWQKVTKNPDLVRQLNNIDPKLVGMFGNMGNFDDPFSYSVYGEFHNMKIGDSGKTVQYQMTPDQILQSNQISDGWSEWHKISAMVEEKAVALGALPTKLPPELQAIKDTAEANLIAKYPSWDVERKAYTDNFPLFIQGARLIVQNSGLVQEDKTVSVLAEYMKIRDMVAAKKSETNNSDTRAQIDQIGYQAAANLRNKDIGFADFYDKYLAKDDFRVV